MSSIDFSTTNFTDKDFPALKKRLNALVKTLYPDWSDEDVLNFGNMMLDAYAFVGDVINFYNDANYREAYIPTAQLLQSMIDLSDGMSVSLPLQERANVDLTFSIEGGYPIDIRVPKNTTFSTSGENSITFQTTSEIIIPASQKWPGALYCWHVCNFHCQKRTEPMIPLQILEFLLRKKKPGA